MFDTDVELVEAVVAGDAAAAEQLAERCRRLVIGLALGRFRLDKDSAEELLQRTMERLWEKDKRALRGWRGEGKVTTYVTVIASRLWLRDQRQRAPEVAESVEDEPPAVRRFFSPQSELATPQVERVAASEREVALKRSLERLSDRDQLLLRLRYEDDEPPARIAPILGLSAGAARKAVHDALGRLRRELSAESPDAELLGGNSL